MPLYPDLGRHRRGRAGSCSKRCGARWRAAHDLGSRLDAAAALLGGTFDPIHVGHLDVARAARRALGLDRVVARAGRRAAAPRARRSRRRRIGSRWSRWPSQDDHGAGRCRTSRLDASRAVVHRRRRSTGWRHAGVDRERVFFITGADAFRDIATWKDYPGAARPLSLRRRVAARVRRPPRCRQLLPALAARMIDAARRRAVTADRSFWWTRRRRRSRRPTSGSAWRRASRSTGLVPPAVAAYIREARAVPHAATIEGADMTQSRNADPASAHPPHAVCPPSSRRHRRRARQEGARPRRARPAQGVGVHGLLRHLHRARTCGRCRRSPTRSRRRSRKKGAQAGARRRLRARRVGAASTTSTSSSTSSRPPRASSTRSSACGATPSALKFLRNRRRRSYCRICTTSSTRPEVSRADRAGRRFALTAWVDSRAMLVAAANALVRVLLAPACAACDGVLDRPLDGPVCARVLARGAAPRAAAAACAAAMRCRPGDARPVLRPVPAAAAGRSTLARSAGRYDGSLRRIIHAFKYERPAGAGGAAGRADARGRRRPAGGRRRGRARAAASVARPAARLQSGRRPGAAPRACRSGGCCAGGGTARRRPACRRRGAHANVRAALRAATLAWHAAGGQTPPAQSRRRAG